MRIRLLPFAVREGADNMAADETLVRSAVDGISTLRFYGWSAPTVSLGYFQSHLARQAHPSLASLDWVRRPSGGATLVHHHELTYALALAPEAYRAGEPWMVRMHRVLVEALVTLGFDPSAVVVASTPQQQGDVLCFQQTTQGDVLCLGRKVVGSAQRRFHQALLQHGSLLLAQSEYTPELPGLQELTGRTVTPAQVAEAVVGVFGRHTKWSVEPGDWTDAERRLAAELKVSRYANPAWNERR